MFNLVGKGADITWGLAAGNAGQPVVVPDVASRVTSSGVPLPLPVPLASTAYSRFRYMDRQAY